MCEEFHSIRPGTLRPPASARGWRSRRGGPEEGFDGSLRSVDLARRTRIAKTFLRARGVGLGARDRSHGALGVHLDDARGEDAGFFERARGEPFEFALGHVSRDDVVAVRSSRIEWNAIDELVVHDLANVRKDVHGFARDGVDVSARGRAEFFAQGVLGVSNVRLWPQREGVVRFYRDQGVGELPKPA